MFQTKKIFGFFSVASLLILIPGSSMATPVVGIANGAATVRVSGSFVDFETLSGSACAAGASLGVAGCFVEQGPTTLDFPAAGTVTTVKDLDQGAGYPFVGAVGALGLSQVIWSNGVTFDLTNLPGGGQPNCTTLSVAQRQAANSTCTFYNPAGTVAGIFTLQNNSNGTSVAITMNWLGNAWKGTNATSSPYQGAFSTQLTDPAGPHNIDGVFNTISQGGFIESSYSVTFAGVVPEPVSSALVGGGLILLALLSKRKLV